MNKELKEYEFNGYKMVIALAGDKVVNIRFENKNSDIELNIIGDTLDYKELSGVGITTTYHRNTSLNDIEKYIGELEQARESGYQFELVLNELGLMK
ncbi:TPA_asm: hypothetical protein GZX72_14660 [Listeria monocytogenes]|nr:hypothetical protein [Listeria monocytogenes]